MSDGFNPEKDICIKCNKIFSDGWERYKTYLGIDEHHNPPEEISNFLNEKWSGEFYRLCRECHIKLHKKITLILKKYSIRQEYNSDYWLMKYSTISKIKEAQEEIYIFTKKWIKEVTNGDTTTT